MASFRLRSNRHARTVAVLDVGSHRICCLLAELEPPAEGDLETAPRLRLLGMGHQRAAGIASGAVVDRKLVEAAVAATIAQAEQLAGQRIDRVHMALTCGSPRSLSFSGHVDLAAGHVRQEDMDRLDAGAHAFAARGGDQVVCLARIALAIDGTPGIKAPLGLAGRRIEGSHHAVVAAPGPVLNLRRAVESCDVEVVGVTLAGYASALAVTTPEERRGGVIVVDIGAGTVSVAGFAEGHLLHAAVLPIGGQHITDDLACDLGLPLAEAERIKTLYGSVAATASDDHETVMVASGRVGESASSSITLGQLTRIVEARATWLMQAIRLCLDGCRIDRLRRAPVVLTGGGALLVGLEALAATMLERRVRMGSPSRMAGAGQKLPGGVQSPSFSCVTGLALAALAPAPWLRSSAPEIRSGNGYLARVEQWLRESF